MDKKWREWDELTTTERIYAELLHKSGCSMLRMDPDEREIVAAYRTHTQTSRRPSSAAGDRRSPLIRSIDDEETNGSWSSVVRAYEEGE